MAGPIGNLEDLTIRAARVLREVDVVACEDTRVTARLLKAAGSSRPMVPFHEHSRPEMMDKLLARAAGEAVALVSDAGTPLVSDPGFKLVRAAHERGVMVTTLPGPSASIAALTVSGLPTDRFLFAGFLPPKRVARQQTLSRVSMVEATLIFYESPNRLAASLQDMAEILGDREAAVVRELTKIHETVDRGTLTRLAARYAEGARGEVVVVVSPPAGPAAADDAGLDRALLVALETLSPGRAAADIAAAFGRKRGDVYQRALALQRDKGAGN